jgi:hypothetical protein
MFASPCIIIRFKQINQKDATVSQVYHLTFMCGSSCFGRLSAHHQERTTALGASGLPLERGGWSGVGRGLAGNAETPTVKPAMAGHHMRM